MEERPILDVAQVVELERRIAATGTSLAELMERAGAAVAEAAKRLAGEAIAEKRRPLEAAAHDACLPLPELGPPSIAVLCGSGNNGGDGWVAAERLCARGWQVTLVSPKAAANISAHPAHEAAVRAATRAGDALTVAVDPQASALKEALDASNAVIDALLGTGFDAAEVREPLASWIRLHNEEKGRAGFVTFAADVPSGLSAQRGTAARACVTADETITMLVAKPGLLVPEAAPYTGRVRVALIDRP